MDHTGLKQPGLAAALGVSQPTVNRWLTGSEPKMAARSKVRAYAEKIGFRHGSPTLASDLNESPSRGVRLVGHVGADARPDAVVMSESHDNLADDLPVPPQLRPGTVAVEVRGDSMRQTAKDGWLVYYDSEDVQSPPTRGLIGHLCVCWLTDGRVLLKTIRRGRHPDTFDLESMNADLLEDQRLMSATKVTFIKPNGPRFPGGSLDVADPEWPIATVTSIKQKNA